MRISDWSSDVCSSDLLGHHAADDCGNGGIVIVIGADVADRKIAHADSPPSLPVMARPTLLPLSRPSSADSQCPVAASAARSTPVCMPMPCSMYSTSSLATLPLAPLAYGQPPVPATAASTTQIGRAHV